MKLTHFLGASALGAAMAVSSAFADTTTIRVQSVLPNTADEVVMLEAFAQDVADLTDGSVQIEVLPAGAVVGPRDIMDAVDARCKSVRCTCCRSGRWYGQHRIP